MTCHPQMSADKMSGVSSSETAERSLRDAPSLWHRSSFAQRTEQEELSVFSAHGVPPGRKLSANPDTFASEAQRKQRADTLLGVRQLISTSTRNDFTPFIFCKALCDSPPSNVNGSEMFEADERTGGRGGMASPPSCGDLAADERRTTADLSSQRKPPC